MNRYNLQGEGHLTDGDSRRRQYYQSIYTVDEGIMHNTTVSEKTFNSTKLKIIYFYYSSCCLPLPLTSLEFEQIVIQTTRDFHISRQ